MVELVRVAIGPEMPDMQWPACCPQCGKKSSLVTSTSRLGQVKSLRPNLTGGFTMKSKVLYLTYPICAQHARETQLANYILEKSPLSTLLRCVVYLGLMMALSLFIGLLTNPKLLRTSHELGFFLLFPVFGVIGALAIIWARQSTSLWPVRFLPDQEVIEIRFAQGKYASKFRALNLAATSLENTADLPWFKRSIVWKTLIIVMFIGFMSKLMK